MPQGKRRYEVQLQSKTGPIDVFLIQDIKLAHDASTSFSKQIGMIDDNSSDPSETDLLKHFDMTSDHYQFDMKEHANNDFAFNDVFDNVFNL